jgi:para-aminobenzoate synthetase / 4-amino-4-deoxychorismate lyase
MTCHRRLELDLAPADLLRALRDRALPFMLTGDWGSGTMLGCDPAEVMHGAQALDVGGRGWWVGYLGYGLGASIERLPPSPPRPLPLATAQMARYEWVLRRPPTTSGWIIEAVDEVALERGLSICDQPAAVPQQRPWSLGPMRAYGPGDDGHRAAVAECTRRIAAGDLFQANICLRLEGEIMGSTIEAFGEACARLQPAHGAYIATEEGAILSFSPELFLKRAGAAVQTAPIKGTAPRDASLPADAEGARAALAGSAKDAAEHVMIVDLMRNDLGRVCEYGSIAADPEPSVQAHPGVWHLVTSVRGRLRDGTTNGELLRATFPPGSVTGAPKVQAMKVIGELEASGREVYTGAIGYIGPGADELELNVAIRTLEVRGNRAWLGAGGGIVADSDTDSELAEAYAKAGPILSALGAEIEHRRPLRPAPPPTSWGRRLAHRPDPGKGLFETVLVSGGHAVELERHLERLSASAAAVYGVTLPPGLAADVRAAAQASVAAGAADAARARARLRITLRAPAEVHIEVSAAGVGDGAITLIPVTVAGGLGPHKLLDREPLIEFERPGQAGLICDADGTVLEASFANVWALIDGRLITPLADGRLLPGTIRARLLEAGHAAGVELASAPFTLQQAHAAQALLTTSSIRLAAPAALPGAQASAAAEQLANALSQMQAVGDRGRLGAAADVEL